MKFTSKLLHRATEKGDVYWDNFRGLPIVVENAKGSIREGVDPSGKPWKITMQCDYGFVPGTEGAGDKEGLDVYIGPDKTSDYAYVIEQLKDNGEFDEYKVVLGCSDLDSAEELYLSNYEEGWGDDHIGDISEIPLRHLFDGIKENQVEISDKSSSLKKRSNSVIDQFLADYDFEKHERIAGEVATLVEDLLRKTGLRALVTHRAKRVESLRNKLQHRDGVEQYLTLQQIVDDIKDLSGVRVALYLPKNRDKVDAIIQSNFEQARPPKHFPQDGDPQDDAGYVATHYAVRWEDSVVEIQVASLLMHAWQEVNHDLRYKPLMGELVPAEVDILKQLNEQARIGESSLEALQISLEGRGLNVMLVSALRKKLAKYAYYEIDTEHVIFSQKLGTAQRIADLSYDKLLELQRVAPVNKDTNYFQMAIREIAPDFENKFMELPSAVQSQISMRAQQLKEQNSVT